MSPKNPRIGVQFQTHGVGVSEFLAATQSAIALGCDAVFVWDHLIPFTGSPPDSAWETWSLLGALGHEVRGTSTTLGVLVSPLTWRHPAILARSAATVASLANGHFVLGVGAGGFVHDDRLMAMEMATARRMSQFVSALEVLRAEVDVQKSLHQVAIDMWVGGEGEKVTIPYAVSVADGWSGFGPPDRFDQRCAVVDAARLTVGRSREQFTKSVLLTQFDEPCLLADFPQADMVIRSVRPERNGTFNLQSIEALLRQRP